MRSPVPEDHTMSIPTSHQPRGGAVHPCLSMAHGRMEWVALDALSAAGSFALAALRTNTMLSDPCHRYPACLPHEQWIKFY